MPTNSDDSPASKADVRELRQYLDERTRDLQTELLRAFADYNNAKSSARWPISNSA